MVKHKEVFAAAVLLSFATASDRVIADKDLFQEATIAGKAAQVDVQWYIFSEIAEAQASHGYYDSALETARLVIQYPVANYPDQLFLKLVDIRARSGDIPGAKKMATAAPTPDLKSRADEAVAILQADAGDLNGARETIRYLPDNSNVLEAIGLRQVDQGDLEGALKTASEMKPGLSDEVLYAVAWTLRQQGHKQRAHQVARRITDRDMARRAERITPESHAEPRSPCQMAYDDAKSGRYADAYKTLGATKCACDTVAYVHHLAGHVTEAARAMRTCENPADVSAGMGHLAEMSAQRGDIANALSFAESVIIRGTDFEEGYLASALREIGRAWGKKNLIQAAQWARSRPNGYQRAMALLGVAETISSVKTDPQAATNQ